MDVLLERLLPLLFDLLDTLFPFLALEGPFFLISVSFDLVQLLCELLRGLVVDVVFALVDSLVLVHRKLIRELLLASEEFVLIRFCLFCKVLLHFLELFLGMLRVTGRAEFIVADVEARVYL